MTATQFIYRAARMLGYTRAGMSLPADMLTDGLEALNNMIDAWRTQSLLAFVISDLTFTLVVNDQQYSIGPSGADFTAARPAYIKDANILLTGTPVVRRTLQILRDSSEWAAIRVRALQNSIPLVLYYEPTVPNGTINIWPAPNLAYQIELFTWAQLTTFADLTTNYSFAPGYEYAIKYNLAVELASMMPDKHGGFSRDYFNGIVERARQGLAELKSLNQTPAPLISDAALIGRRTPAFNYRTGNLA